MKTEEENTPSTGVMDESRARIEILKWLSESKFSQSKIDKNEDLVVSLCEAMQEGRLSIQTDGRLKYKLIEPLKYEDGEMFLEEVTVKNRINYNSVKPHMKGIKADDAIGLMHAYGCALIGDQMSTFNKLDTRDSGLLRSLATLFFVG